MSVNKNDMKWCTGCAACVDTCKYDYINMKVDSSGFMYPDVDEKCLECGKCERACPVLSNCGGRNIVKRTYAAWSNDSDLRFYSTSGGVFSEIAKEFVSKGGIVCGAKYIDPYTIAHSFAKNMNEIKLLAQSKYVQSNTEKIYRQISDYLSQGYKVLFCGTPCQASSLNRFCTKNNDNLYIIDFICRGVNSPKAYISWLKEIEICNNSSVESVWFKYKDRGWKNSPKTTLVSFSDGTKKVYRGDENKYMYGYLGPNLYIRPSCETCHFKGMNRSSDITLGDFWGIEKELDDDHGTSMVNINSPKGEELFQSIVDKVTVKEKTIDDVPGGNMCFENSVVINQNSKKFLEEIDYNGNFSKLVDRYTHTDPKKRVLNVIKNHMKRMLKK